MTQTRRQRNGKILFAVSLAALLALCAFAVSLAGQVRSFAEIGIIHPYSVQVILAPGLWLLLLPLAFLLAALIMYARSKRPIWFERMAWFGLLLSTLPIAMLILLLQYLTGFGTGILQP